ncbi:hypothetical protein HanLR1_Chr14g0540421 [Helianthus annuus]|nr:hypothetical protein HanHA89_Chr14g0578001 [Helianthus annuus]KAJ0656839.1 hypothetical protein HanLR1_Chr14g0540421 [Helianthus annuus]
MANNHGSKFVSVNLNKLYAQPSHHNYHSHTGSYGPPGAGANRARPTSAGGGGGMVVLSRNRPLQKAVPKLSVPPPLNLPSLRKEYEKTDSSGAGGGGPGAAGSGTGSRPSSSGMGWTKPGNIALQEKEVASDTLVSENVNYSAAKGSGAYMPPSARFGGGDTPSANQSHVEKAMVLRGEDFPSLRAALPSSSTPAQKHKEGSLQPVKKLVSEESSNDLRDASHFHSPAPMQSSHRMANDVNESPRPNRARLDHALKQEDPLSFLRLNPRSDWADDERDTGHRFAGRDQDLPKSEVYWDRDLDVPRSSILPQKPSSNMSERKGVTSQVLKAEPYRETNSWRSSSIHKERPTGAHAISEGTVTNHFSNSNTHHGVVTENRDPAFVRRDTGQGRHWNHNVEYSKSRNEGYQNSTGSKSVFSLGGKSSFSKSERTYLDDSFQKDFSSSVYDERDPLTGNLVGVMKRKKGLIEQTAFHDPVRESFEAELERVQKMQEMERQRVVEEQERALEEARREDEERRRVILEEEERRRRMEEEAAVEHEQTQNAFSSTSSGLVGDPAASSVDVSSSCQSTMPIKLQFGLFSGPTLIPSPVPAIQIGSIQMPLHFPPPAALSLGHIHPSQRPPLFQFGQLNYSSPVTQQPVSLVQPNFHHTQTHFNLNQNSGCLLPNQLSQDNSINIKNEAGSANLSNNQSNLSHASDNIIASKPVTQTEEKCHGTSNNDSRGLSADKNVPLLKAPGPSNRGKRTVYPPRNSGPRSFQAYEPMGSNEFQRKQRRPIQRTEFRVRDNNNNSGLDDKLNNKGMGTSTRSGYRRQTGSTTLKRVVHEAGMNSEKETSRTKTQTASSAESNQQRDIVEEDIDAPLQSGVVRVFKQPGIECLSDEDDFIEVRSKRQMLNDRREQREKEIKAKSRVTKQPRKARVTSTGHKNKLSASLVGEASNNNRSDVGLVKKEHTVDYSTMASQPMAPIGTATVDTDVQTGIRTLQSGSALSGAAEDHGSNPNLMFQTENEAVENVQTPLDDWGNARSDQQVPLTQIQLDEAMKPLSFSTTHIPSIGDHTTLVNEPILPSSSILTKGKSVSSSSSPINSLLAGEKIQFGAVTSPTILPPSSRIVSHGIGAPGAFRSDITQTTQNMSKAENDCNIFLKKDAHSTEGCEAEVESAVAAIDTDEIVGNGLARVSVSGTESFGGAVEGIQAGLAGDQQSGSQSKPEESLSVSLPADLSVETPPISLWPPLPSPQGSSPQMLSHYHGPTPSHFPFYDMNHPMMSAPVFAFGSPEESGGTQPQSQKPTGSAGSRHIGPWQNHSGMDSFYGPPAGFTGPFLGSPGGIPGVQAPPHMVVYNHYSPVGQFGQVGLSFMGATYIPSGKQPDWKHDPTSSTRNEDAMSSMNMVSGPRNPPNMQQPPVQQHLAPGSPLLPMGSPLTMFDVPPFQTAPDMSVQARWSHVPASSLHAVPMPPPLQQQAKVMTGPSQFGSHGGGHPGDQSTFPPNRLSEPQRSGPSVVFPVIRDSTITHFPDELGLLESSGPSISTTSPVTINHNTSATTKSGDGGGVDLKNQHQQGKNSNNNNNNNNNHGGGYGYQRGGGVSPKNKSMWSHRRTGRYMGAEKGFPSSTKVKQIYVAKQPTGSSSTVG